MDTLKNNELKTKKNGKMKHQKEENQKNKQHNKKISRSEAQKRTGERTNLHHNIPAIYATQAEFPNEQNSMRGPKGRHALSCH
jgi:hypothetical protein